MSEVRFNKDRLVEIMNKRGMGNTKLAKLTGVSRTMIHYLKTGERKTASIEIIAKFAEALGTTVDYFVGENNGDGTEQATPEPIKRLSEVAGRMSQLRQEELVQIAETLDKLDREQTEHPLTPEQKRALFQIQKLFRQQGGRDEDILPWLEALLRNPPPSKWTIDLSDSEDVPDEPPEDE